MILTRYMMVQAIKTDDNVLIPIWDSKLKFHATEDMGDEVRIEGDYNHYSQVIDCIFDLKTKTVSAGIELDYYPKESELDYKKEETVYYNNKARNIIEVKIENIVYEEFDLCVCKGSKLDKYWIDRFKMVSIEPNSLYAIKSWKPLFVLSDGTKTKWSHELFHKS